MPKIICYVPTYSPVDEAQPLNRPYTRLSQQEIKQRLHDPANRTKPGMYMDAIDSILNIRPDIELVVADGRSTESIRTELGKHQHHTDSGHFLNLYPERMSQWAIFNDIYNSHDRKNYDYFVYSSSDVIWTMDWVEEAIQAFGRNPKLQILFPLVSNGDTNIPCQTALYPRDEDPVKPPYDHHGKAPVLNAYVMIFRMDFLREYGGYPDIFRNCFTESFLHYMCQAMGGEMRLLPRGWCWHWSLGDKWEENGSHYYFNQEFSLFQNIMGKVQMAYGAGIMTPAFLKKILYKEKA